MNGAAGHFLRCRTADPRAGRGFTIIEMLLALVIGTMILSASAGVYVTTLDAWRRGSRAYAEAQAAEKISALIERHLRAAVSPALDNQAVFTGEDLATDAGQPAHRLTLRSTAPGRFPRNLPPTDVCEIAFEFDPTTGDGMTLRIQCPPDDEPDEGGYLVHLSPLIRGFRVIYFDGTQWVESWSENELPEAVEFTLQINRLADEIRSNNAPEQPPIEVTRLVWLPMGKTDTDQQNSTQPAGGAGATVTGGQPQTTPEGTGTP